MTRTLAPLAALLVPAAAVASSSSTPAGIANQCEKYGYVSDLELGDVGNALSVVQDETSAVLGEAIADYGDTTAAASLDEVFSVLCEMQTGKREKAPIVLLGSDYWQPIVDACERVMLSEERQTVSPEDFRLLTVVDGADAAWKALHP